MSRAYRIAGGATRSYLFVEDVAEAFDIVLHKVDFIYRFLLHQFEAGVATVLSRGHTHREAVARI